MNPFDDSNPLFTTLPHASNVNEESFGILDEEFSPNFVKRSHSKEEPSNTYLPDIALKKCFSLPINDENDKSNSSNIFKIRWMINNLIQMEFDINICYHIIERMEIHEKTPDVLFNEILDRYDKYLKDLNLKKGSSFYEFTHNKLKKIFSSKSDDERKKEVFEKKNENNSFMIEITPKENEIIEDTNFILCEICYEKQNPDNFHEIPGCLHSFCKTCFVNYFTQRVNSSDLIKIPCPSNCGYDLSEEEIEEILKDSYILFQKYKKLKSLMILNSDPNLRWCVGNGCNNLIKKKGKEIKLKCDKCGQEVCFKCRAAWHHKLTCVQALDNEFKMYSKNFVVKYCPNCNSRIEKLSGCNHMHCTRCRYEFCWLCRRKYTINHYKSYNIFGCPNNQYLAIDENKNKLYQRLKCFLQLLAVLILLLPAILGCILAILFAVFGTLPYIYFVYFPQKSKVVKAFGVLVGIVGVILSPIVLVLLIAPGSCMLYREYKKREES